MRDCRVQQEEQLDTELPASLEWLLAHDNRALLMLVHQQSAAWSPRKPCCTEQSEESNLVS